MTETSVGPTEDGSFVQSLARGLAVLRAFDAEHHSLRATEVAERAGVTRAAARRFLLTLVELGYVATDGTLYRLTPRVLEFGGGYLAGLRLDQIVQPHLRELSAALGESVSAATLDGDQIVYVARVAARRIMSVNISVGTRFPAFATAMGRVLIAAQDQPTWGEHLGAPQAVTPRTLTDVASLRAELVRVREQGWAHVDGELEEGLQSVAVPVQLPAGEVLAVNVALGPVRSRPEMTVEDLVRALQSAAEHIAADARAVASRG